MMQCLLGVMIDDHPSVDWIHHLVTHTMAALGKDLRNILKLTALV
jgi:hypothetical protein